MKIGGDSISAVTLGTTSVQKLMLGNEQVWPEPNLPNQFTEADLTGMSIGDTVSVIVNLPQMEAGKQWLCTSGSTHKLGFAYNTENITSATTDTNCVFTLEKTTSGFTLTPSDTTNYSIVHWNINRVITGKTDDAIISADPLELGDGTTFVFHNGEIRCLTGYWADYIGGLWRNLYDKPQLYSYAGVPTYLELYWRNDSAPYQDIEIYKITI